ncbi:hypothetical protein K503DRAFT_324602 [Rhizopogon vinicolor AM-OR11-026]|uniref:Uncharacterized protein n=1 Tax=Rhizopogon vinicolor AM-OR11-026 TaxID=1314800 RepID=A0A1B7NCM6_9AGAM|nr:hypothetical protein K503DRAFT_324602 [Rhizopogon vinicolor AM-OR11-026]
MTSYIDDLKNQTDIIDVNNDECGSSEEEFPPEPEDLIQGPMSGNFKYDEDNSFDEEEEEEEEFTPEPEDSIQVQMSGFSERGPQDKTVSRGQGPEDKNKKQDNQPPKEPTIIKRPAVKESKKISGAKYK